MDNTNIKIVNDIKETKDDYILGSSVDRRRNILNIANKALAGDIYFTTYTDYIKWMRNPLIVTGAYKNNNGDTE